MQIGPGQEGPVRQCVALINDKLMEFVVRGVAQAAAAGVVPSNIPRQLIDEEMNFVPIEAREIDPKQQL